MIPIETRGATKSFTKPEGWDDEKDGWCGVLSVRVEDVGALRRRSHHVSTWKPSPQEIARLVNGGSIELTCVGVQPPVAMEVIP